MYEILGRTHKDVQKSSRLHSALPSPSRVDFWNPKTIKDKLVLSELKKFIYRDAGSNICGHSNFDVCKVFEKGGQFEKM